MTGAEIAAYGSAMAVIFKFLLDAYGKYTAKARDEAAAEADRIAARDKTQRENEGWLRGKVDEMVSHERELYRTTLASMERRIVALESALAESNAKLADAEERLSAVPNLVEDLGRMLSRIDPSRTPTASEIAHLRRAGEALGLTTHSVNGFIAGKAGS
jgi:chromosome segregation ATPase